MKPKNYHGAKKPNPALKYQLESRNIEEKLKNALKDGVSYGILCSRVVFAMIKIANKELDNGFDDNEIGKMIQEICDSLITEYMPLKDFTLKVALRKNDIFRGITVDDVVAFDPGLGAYM